MTKQKVILRPELLNKSEFARRYKVSRTKLDYLIAEGLLNVEQICGVFYINIKDMAIVDNALGYKTQRSGTWGRNQTFKPYMPKSEEDAEFEAAWRKDQGME